MRLLGFEIKRSKGVGRNKLVSNLLWPWMYGNEIGPDSDFSSLLKAYRGWVYTASSKNSTAVASTPLRLYAGKPGYTPIKSHPTHKISRETKEYIVNSPTLSTLPQVKKAAEIVEVEDHVLLDLFREVNPFMNHFYLFELTSLYQELCGNAYWFVLRDKLGVPREIWPIPPGNLKVIPDKTEFIRGYRFTRGFDTVDFGINEIVHFKFPSPINLYYGSSPLVAVSDSYNISQAMNKYEQAVFANMGRLEGAFETENELSQYEFDRLKEEIKQTFRGIDNVGKSPLLEKGVKYKSYGTTPRELNYLAGRSKIKEEIINAYGQSLGLWDKDATRANATVANENFMRDAIRPRLRRQEQKINEQLTPMFDSKLFVAYDDPVPVDQEIRLRQLETRLKTGYSSVNIEREIDREPSVPWGDIPIMNQNMIPLGSNISDDNGGGGDEPDDGDEEMSDILKEGIGSISDELVNRMVDKLMAAGR